MPGPDPNPRPLDHLTRFGAPDAPALVTREGVLDYAGLEREVGKLAGGLRARGLAQGDRVASWLPKSRMTSLLPLAAPARAWSMSRSILCSSARRSRISSPTAARAC